METYKKKLLIDNGITDEFVQDNLSFSFQWAVRGLHFQIPPFAQAKLVTVFQGKALDVAVDIRRNSPTYGKSFEIELSDEQPLLFYIPPGFAHGFSVLSETCLFYYKCSQYYNKDSECGILWNDASLSINWQINNPIVSEKDQQLPLLRDFDSSF